MKKETAEQITDVLFNLFDEMRLDTSVLRDPSMILFGPRGTLDSFVVVNIVVELESWASTVGHDLDLVSIVLRDPSADLILSSFILEVAELIDES